MARLPRLVVAGEAHLVTWAGLPERPVFFDDADRRAFLDALHQAAADHGCQLLAYCLPADHVHLLLTPEATASLSLTLQSTGRRYVAGFNRRHGRRGTLWAGRFGATVVPADRLLAVMAMLDGHAWRAGSIERLDDDTTSSARAHLGLVRDPRLSAPAAWWQLGNTPFDREIAWRRRLEAGEPGAAWARAWGQASRRSWLVDEAVARKLATPASRAGFELPEAAPRRGLPRPKGRPKTNKPAR